jgi:hypothetical protein
MFDHEFSDAAVDVDVALRAPEGLQRRTSGTYVKLTMEAVCQAALCLSGSEGHGRHSGAAKG